MLCWGAALSQSFSWGGQLLGHGKRLGKGRSSLNDRVKMSCLAQEAWSQVSAAFDYPQGFMGKDTAIPCAPNTSSGAMGLESLLACSHVRADLPPPSWGAQQCLGQG